MPAEPTDVHRMMIQTLMSRRHIPDKVAEELYKRCIAAVRVENPSYTPSHRPDRKGVRAFIQECSSMLEEQDLRLEVRVVNDETQPGRETYVLINTDGTDEARGMSDYDPLQISYFREVAGAIITSYPGNSIGSSQALNLVDSLKGHISKSVAENLLKSFVARGWLALSEKRGRYSLTPRTVVELDGWLQGEYGDYMQECARCRKTVLSGVKCSADDCEAHYHGSCYSVIQDATRSSAKCLKCKNTFDDYPPTPLGEKAVSSAQDDFSSVQRKRKRPAGRKSRVQEPEEEDELDQVSDEEDDLEYGDP